MGALQVDDITSGLSAPKKAAVKKVAQVAPKAVAKPAVAAVQKAVAPKKVMVKKVAVKKDIKERTAAMMAAAHKVQILYRANSIHIHTTLYVTCSMQIWNVYTHIYVLTCSNVIKLAIRVTKLDISNDDNAYSVEFHTEYFNVSISYLPDGCGEGEQEALQCLYYHQARR